jgi:GNAT superfamily N-acetyltransferase
MAMTWEFTQATREQAEDIHNLVNGAYRGDSSRKGWTTEADLLDGQRIDLAQVQEMILSKGAAESVILVAENEDTGELDGCVHLENQNGQCYLGMLTVKPTLQKKGLGAMLLEEAEAFAEFWGCAEMCMTVIEQRSELIQWYQKHGYKLTKEKRPFPADPRFGIPKVSGLQFVVLNKKLT